MELEPPAGQATSDRCTISLVRAVSFSAQHLHVKGKGSDLDFNIGSRLFLEGRQAETPEHL